MSKKRQTAKRKKRKKVKVKRSLTERREDKDKLKQYADKLRRNCGEPHAKLLDADFLPLIKLVLEGIININTANGVASSSSIAMGMVEDVFEDCTPDTVYKWRNLVLPNGAHGEFEGIVKLSDGHYRYLDAYRERPVLLTPGTNLYVSDFSSYELPYDMRNWPSHVLKSYFKSKFSHVHTISMKDRIRSKAIFDYDPITDQVHSIRRINRKPSKLQIRRIDREREANAREVDPSYSAES